MIIRDADRTKLLALVERAERAERDRAAARLTLERLRYKWWERRGTLGSLMQRIGNFGRDYFGFWDKNQTGGGWW